MKMANSYHQNFKLLQEQIEAAQKINKPTESYVKKQIEMLEQAHDEFIQKAVKEGFDVENDTAIGEVELKQYSAMKQLAQKIGVSPEKYDKSIRELRVKMLGEDVVKQHFD